MREMITVANGKGGVGKTTTAVNLAAALRQKGFKVLIVDCDSQMNASYCNGWRQEYERMDGKRTLFHALVNGSALPVYKSALGSYFTPSSRLMATVDPDLQRQISPNSVLSEVMQQPVDDQTGEGIKLIKDCMDYVIFDCPPSLGNVTLNAMVASTGLLIPVQLEGFSIRGLGEIIDSFKRVQRSLNPGLKVRGMLLTMANKQFCITRQYLETLEANFGKLIFDTMIRKSVSIPESQDASHDIFAYAPKSNGAKDYMAFCEEFLQKAL